MIRRPTVGRFENEIDELQDKLDEIAVLFRRVARDITDRRDRESSDAGPISGGGHSDPTGSVVVEHEYSRALLTRTMKKIEGMSKSADKMIEKLLEFYDPPEHETLTGYTTPDPDTLRAQNAARRALDKEADHEKRRRIEARLRRAM